MSNDQSTAAETDAERYIRETLFANGRNPSGSLPERMGVRFHAVSAERLVATMPVAGNTQPYGLLHGGASVVLAESLGSLGATLHAGPGRVAAGLEVSATHHRSVTSGQVTGTATAIRLGRSVATYEVVITDEANRRVCTSRVTCLVRPAPPADRPAPPNEAG